MKRIFLTSLWSIAAFSALYSQASFNSINSGNWNAPTTWTVISGSDADGIPDADDSVKVFNAKIVVVNVNSASHNVTVEGAGSVLTINANRILTVSGDIHFLNSATGPQLAINASATVRIAKVFKLDGDTAQAISPTNLVANAASVIQYNGIAPHKQVIVATDYGRLWISGTSKKVFSTAGPLRILNNAANCLTVTGVTDADVNSTIEFAGRGLQTIPAFGYFNLTSSATGARTLASGTIRIAGAFTPGTNIYNVPTNNTINYTGTGAQTIVPFEYQNLSATAGTRTLAPGVIKVKGSLNLIGSATYISTGNTIEFTTAGSFLRTTQLNNILISGTLNIASNYQITLLGNFVNNGILNHTAGSVIFSGTVAQSIGGTASKTTFYNVNVNNTVGLTVNHPVELLNTLTLGANAKLFTGDNLTLKSTAALTARLATIPAGATLSGKLTMERYINPDITKEEIVSSWRTVCAPVITTVKDWIGDFPTAGFPGADYDSTNTSNFCSIQTYNETVFGPLNKGFVNIAGTTEPILPGKGFSTYIRPTVNPPVNSPFILSTKGTIYNGDVNVPVTKTDSVIPTADNGWNLVGNPYASAINWNAIAGLAANRAVINTTYSIYIPKLNVWGSYTPGIGAINGVTNVIPSSTAVWVKAKTNGNLRFTETNKIAGGDPYNYSPTKAVNSSFKLRLAGNNLSDEAIVAFNDQATTSNDDEFDVLKFPGGEGAPYIATVMNNDDLSINALPNTINEITLPLRIKVAASGTFTVSKILNPDFGSTACVILEDKVTGTKTNLTGNAAYTFTINDTTEAPRFLVHVNFSEGLVLNTTVTNGTCKVKKGKVIVNTGKTQEFNFKWYDSTHTVIQTTSNNGIDSLINLSPGKYSVEVSDGSICGQANAEFEVRGEPQYTESYVVQPAICYGNNNDVFIIAAADTLGAPIQYQWLDSAGNIIRSVRDKRGADTISYLEPGKYKVIITYNGACASVEKSFTLDAPAPIVADFTASSVNVDIKDGPVKVDFTNKSSNSDDYMWTFGEGDTLYTKDASHIYSQVGDYDVVLTVSDFECGNADSKVINVHVYDSNTSDVIALETNKSVFIGNDFSGSFVRFGYIENTNAVISVTDLLGRNIIKDLNVKPNNQTVYLDLTSVSPQLLLIRVSTNNNSVTKKIIKN